MTHSFYSNKNDFPYLKSSNAFNNSQLNKIPKQLFVLDIGSRNNENPEKIATNYLIKVQRFQ